MTRARFKQLLIERMKIERVFHYKLVHFVHVCVANKLVGLVYMVEPIQG